ncbi:bile acid:sodium symporter [Polynucleobacter sp. MWH-Loch1C5]|jgi:BASS family bile acid:Na+ symporter|uniref:bile acid:sodium symporter family protein n=1 Tax=Polynucleobacter sp. MWH-Loch1C5 TaxID=2689108 RepID=UPI001C0E17E5|nr:bile acid:sodium symporter [Polynucleobacter sp. MWH-Loch1C5]MBU3543089.1 bile acid:sodium symporter [Polynucleobacter sp. MWH-Loch1C5]
MVTEFETKLLGMMMIIIMLGMGASLTWRDFLISFRKPKRLILGLFLQYGLMSFIGFSLVKLLGLPPAIAIGLILMSCMPGGTTSNIFTYFCKGDLALSIMMTCVSTLAALVMVPATIAFYSNLAGFSGDYVIPAENVAQVLVVLLVPTVIGVILRKLNANVGATVELIGAAFGVGVILFLVVTWIPRNYQLLLDTPITVYAGAIGLGLIGMLATYYISRGAREDKNRARTIALEIGIQNGPLAILIVTLNITGPNQQDVLLIPVLYSLFIVVNSTILTFFFRRKADEEAAARDRAKLAKA